MFDGIPITSLTAPSLLGLCILFVLLGRLIPKPFYDDKKEEVERWRLAYENEREARILSDAQTVELLELAKTTHDIIVVMFSATNAYNKQSGGTDAVVPTRK